MLSAGNDIVSLNETDVTRTLTKQFYSKILTAAEVALYGKLEAPVPFEHYIWLLWSIKESAYKFLKRLNPELLFTPVKFEISELDIPNGYSPVGFAENESALIITGRMEFNNYELYFRSAIYKELITSVVDSDENFEGVHWGTKYINSIENAIQSAEVRSFLIGELEKITGRLNLNIKKDQQDIPVLFDGSQELTLPVSLSHHGNYIAYSFKLKQ